MTSEQQFRPKYYTYLLSNEAVTWCAMVHTFFQLISTADVSIHLSLFILGFSLPQSEGGPIYLTDWQPTGLLPGWDSSLMK